MAKTLEFDEYAVPYMDEKELRRWMHILRARMSRRYTRWQTLLAAKDQRALSVLSDYRTLARQHLLVESALGDMCEKLYGTRGPYRKVDKDKGKV